MPYFRIFHVLNETLCFSNQGSILPCRKRRPGRLSPAPSCEEILAMTDLSDISISGLWRVLAQDLDPVETKEWLDAFDAIVENEGAERATFVLRRLLDPARMVRVPMPPVLNTPYANTVSLADQPQ